MDSQRLDDVGGRQGTSSSSSNDRGKGKSREERYQSKTVEKHNEIIRKADGVITEFLQAKDKVFYEAKALINNANEVPHAPGGHSSRQEAYWNALAALNKANEKVLKQYSKMIDHKKALFMNGQQPALYDEASEYAVIMMNCPDWTQNYNPHDYVQDKHRIQSILSSTSKAYLISKIDEAQRMMHRTLSTAQQSGAA
ncbi:hypothetical protein CBS101457_000033 [Exobasidium rhododendri]|nr:hypothetical protein CBS101457_000033 [Exobasidium rhododendri]